MITDEERSNIAALAKEGDAEEIEARAAALEAETDELRERAALVRQALLGRTPLSERLVYAADARCACGAGLAYDPASEGEGVFKGPASEGEGVFKGPDKWECSSILLKDELSPEDLTAAKAATHDRGFPFAFYEIKSERQPSQGGRTTRPGGVARGVYSS
jgi:hypothetical protein